nr:hypothetical protein [Tanacetum cinerariifolium]
MLCYFKSIKYSNTSIERLCLGEDNRISLDDGIESNGEWDTPEYHDTANRGRYKGKKNKDNVIHKELIVALKGDIYFVKFIINHEEDDIEPGVVLGRSFLRLTKGIADFRNEIITIYPYLDDDSDKANDSEDVRIRVRRLYT